LKPAGAVVVPDDKGLWWPTVPPRPSVDEVEQRKKSQEEAGKPELIKDVQYKLTKFKSEVGSRKSEVKNGLMPPN
jgi:AMMECR1 domain-containing protein